MFLVLILAMGLSQRQGHGMVGRNMSLKDPVIPPGIDPGTIRLVAQHLNHYATPGSWSGPEGSRKLRFPHFMTVAQDGGQVVNLTHRPSLPPRK